MLRSLPPRLQLGRNLFRDELGARVLRGNSSHQLSRRHIPPNASADALRCTLHAAISAHLFISYLTEISLIGCGLAMLVKWKSRPVAIWLGIVTLLVVGLVYPPVVFTKPLDIGNGLNYLR